MTESAAEIEEYCAAVRSVLDDLPLEVRDDLLDDLPDHLREVLAEGEGSLRERLGEPMAYAAELRAAAGLPPNGDGPRFQARLISAVRSSDQLWHRVNTRAGHALGYPKFADLVRALAPGWWLLRGWIAAELVCGVSHYGDWTGFVPYVGNSRLAGAFVTLGMIVASIAIGRRTSGASRWPRLAAYGLSAGLALWAVTVLAHQVTKSHYAFGGYVSDNGGSIGSGYVSEIYPYDQAGNPLTGVRLYDQDGNPIQVGSDTCQNGSLAPGVPYNQPQNQDPYAYATGVPTDPSTQAWSYPLCPSDVGPFRSGPGAAPGLATSATPSSAPSSAPNSSAPSSSSPVVTPSASLTPSPTPKPTPHK